MNKHLKNCLICYILTDNEQALKKLFDNFFINNVENTVGTPPACTGDPSDSKNKLKQFLLMID